MDPLKAAGPDNIQNILIQNAYKYIKFPLLKLYKQSHITGYIPKPWRETKGIFQPKPVKVDYNDPKSYRTITLSSNFLKIHEHLILWFMEHDLGLDNTLNKKRYGFRKGCSTEAALHKIVHTIERRIKKRDMFWEHSWTSKVPSTTYLLTPLKQPYKTLKLTV